MTRPLVRSKAVPLFVFSVLAASAFGMACARQEGAPQGTAATPAAMTLADSIALGERLSYTTGCNDCHTPGFFYNAPDYTRMLSGSEVGWTGPWGTTYPRNLTPDVETGIGSWSEDDIVKAVRTGQRPDGSPLLPPMPWPNFARMTDLEAHSLAKFLKSIPAIKHAMPPADPPGKPASRPSLVIPAPPEWDVPKAPASPTSG